MTFAGSFEGLAPIVPERCPFITFTKLQARQTPIIVRAQMRVVAPRVARVPHVSHSRAPH